jgi:hypothetical protein
VPVAVPSILVDPHTVSLWAVRLAGNTPVELERVCHSRWYKACISDCGYCSWADMGTGCYHPSLLPSIVWPSTWMSRCREKRTR